MQTLTGPSADLSLRNISLFAEALESQDSLLIAKRGMKKCSPYSEKLIG